jgi:alkylation response protein AidB-like acyl-CoA dehydrogenase
VSDRYALETETQQWVAANWDLAITVREWWSRLVDSGLAYPSWPSGVGGRAASVGTALVVRNVLARNEVVAPPVGHVAATLAAPTLFDHGSSDQVNALVRPIALGEAAWCQLFSEPGAGSDLASVSTRAVRDGDEWVVTGQKVWNSGADSADLGMLLARTDPAQPQHEGMTYFVIDMDQVGVDVRPLRQMNGQSSFCEVFLNEARIPANRVIGQVNGGWKVARTTLHHERNSVAGGGLPGLTPARSGSHGDLDRAVGDVIDRARHSAAKHRNTIRGGAVPTKRMIDLAHEYGKDGDPGIRQELARYASQVRVNGEECCADPSRHWGETCRPWVWGALERGSVAGRMRSS